MQPREGSNDQPVNILRGQSKRNAQEVLRSHSVPASALVQVYVKGKMQNEDIQTIWICRYVILCMLQSVPSAYRQ
jgi:hypothetical protein